MPYLLPHHGSFWFQIRVPKHLVPRYGALIRQNLQTNDRRVAQALAYKLASHWLTQFALDTPRVGSITSAEAIQTPMSTYLAQSHAVDASQPSGNPAGSSVSRKPKEGNGSNSATFDGLLAYWRQLHPECAASTYREMSSVVDHFKKTIGKAPGDLDRIDIAAYRDKLIAARKARATVSKRIGFISTLLQTAYDAGELPQNVARGIKIPKPKVETVSRRAFTQTELSKIFTSPVYSQRRRDLGGGGEACAWVPLIALATGARLEEICQLRSDDLVIDPTHGALMRISDDAEGQRLKTSGSRRTIPLHPELIRCGLLDYHETLTEVGHEWLFPALEPDHDGRRGGNLSKWFARYLRSHRGCAIADRRVVFHSFRHTFKTLCREAGLSEEVHDALTGHVSSSVGRGYGHVPISVLVDAVSRINFSIALPRIAYVAED